MTAPTNSKAKPALRLILVADDDDGHRIMLEALLGKWGYAVHSASNGLEAVNMVRERPYDAVLLDIRMPELDGLAAQAQINAYNPAVPVIIMTAYSAVQSAVRALKEGAKDYLIKPLDFDELKLTLERVLEHSRLVEENFALRGQNQGTGPMIGNSPALLDLQTMIATVAPTEATVLISGKSGTGKELVARALHQQSNRAKGPFVAVNCAALSENLLESELFGHEKGSFTGADKRRDGRFLQAENGSLFLDEIGEISPQMQVKLLRALQQKEIQRVGGNETLRVNARIIAATNRDLQAEIKAGRFREDLYYRLNVVSLEVPALADRPQDIPLLAQHFLSLFARKNHKNVRGFTPGAMNSLLKYAWPGNVRELENAIERAVVLLAGEFVSERELPENVVGATQPGCAEHNLEPEPRTLQEMERQLILRTLEETGQNKSEAAKRLGISRKTLHSKLNAYQESEPD